MVDFRAGAPSVGVGNAGLAVLLDGVVVIQTRIVPCGYVRRDD
jgi:hypothetical protein